MNHKKKILLAMSGGIDSSITAYLLKNMGYKVEGIFMKNWNYEKNCSYIKDFIDVNIISNKLKIKLHIKNFSKDYWKKVFKKFISEYKLGNTPNPDILCNKYIKFNKLIKFSKKINASYISTGHYVRILKIKNKYFLLKSKNNYYDQSYFLSSINEKILKYCIFPLGNFNKNYIRKIAKKLNFINYNKPSSKGICFINNKSFKNFIKNFIKDKQGKIISNNDNKIIGYHNGLHFYTIGQRKGINIGGKKEYLSKPWYVTKKDNLNNILYVSQNKNINFLSIGAKISNINWISYRPKSNKFEISIKLRFSNKIILSDIYILNKNEALIIFKKKNGIVVPGQYIVFYIKDFCIGNGKIINEIF